MSFRVVFTNKSVNAKAAKEMGFFSRKPKVPLEEFCRKFYDNNILHPVIAGLDVGSLFFDSLKQIVTEADASFAYVDSQSFNDEMNVIRFEVFALAWLHLLGDKSGMAQSVFTRQYLESEGRLDIWENMELYNRAVARSSTHGCSTDNAAGRLRIAFVDSFRFELAKTWLKKPLKDPMCAGRVVNRTCTESAWKDRITTGYLMLTLCDRLHCDVNREAQGQLIASIIGLYKGASESIAEVRIG